ncbi:lipid-A-disaccharide synthase [Variovorax dokdonensis]|uniref:Lipid-A-disaccharide synthase n=1 Tax=Variovorax dokdonensis TaxID=344883 RepID=A0ABT7N8Q5_9BURK|nr:lipid-A-disaccharide synthase [Variovorax dokdonensis]MDM0044325.1 lipid-A-disaccharide synthase [Variovorax dokdonensis]
MNASQRRFAMVAGEASGDLLAGRMLDGFHSRWPDVQAIGIGGPQMVARGFQTWWPQEKLAVRGYIEVLRHYPEIASIRRQLKARVLHERPDVFIGVDAPDFNLGLEADLRAAGIRTVHFVCPSIWAWRPGRIENIRAAADHVLCIFPFEPELLASHGVAGSYVGHPLAQVIPMEPDRAAARAKLGLSTQAPVVALLPGSRRSELRYIAPRFLDAARLMRKTEPHLQLVLPTLPTLIDEARQMIGAAGLEGQVHLIEGRSHEVLAACDVTLIASGTATLEAALFKRPMVIAYNMNYLTWRLMLTKQLQPWVGLPNILCRDFVVPELIQNEATPEALARSTLDWLRSPAKVSNLTQRFTALHEELLRDTPTLCADAIEKVLAS